MWLVTLIPRKPLGNVGDCSWTLYSVIKSNWHFFYPSRTIFLSMEWYVIIMYASKNHQSYIYDEHSFHATLGTFVGTWFTFSLSIHQPFNATRITASGISDRVKELEKDGMSREQKNSKKGFWEEFEVSRPFCLHKPSIRSFRMKHRKHKNTDACLSFLYTHVFHSCSS